MEDKIQMMDGAIKYLAKKYSNRMMSRDDLYNVGVQAILEAQRFVDDIKSEKDFYFVCISNAIVSAAINSDVVVHIPSGTITSGAFPDLNKYKGKKIGDYIGAKSDNHDTRIDANDILSKCDPEGIAKMHYIEGYTYPEISEMIGVSRTTVCRYIKKFKEKARKLYDV